MMSKSNNSKRDQLEEKTSKRRLFVKSIKAEADRKRTFSQRFADWATQYSGSVFFLLINIGFFVVWIVINLGLTSIEVFDPFPFGLLTMVVSLEAIILAVLVLISQNREERINALRDEINLQLEIIMEKKIIKIMEKIDKLLEKQGLEKYIDDESEEMLEPTNIGKIGGVLEKQI